MKPFVFEHYDELPEVETIHNNGHSIVISLEESEDSLYPKVGETSRMAEVAMS
jgi:hypothetical protein